MKFNMEGIMKLDGYYDEESWAEVKAHDNSERIRIDKWSKAGLKNVTPKSMEPFGDKKVRVTIETLEPKNEKFDSLETLKTIREREPLLNVITFDEYNTQAVREGTQKHYYVYKFPCENCKEFVWVGIKKGVRADSATGRYTCPKCECKTNLS